MRQMISMRRLGSKSRLLGAALVAALLPAACANPFDTSVENPNAVVEEALGDPAGATTLVNGLGASVTRALTGIAGVYAVSSDEMTWTGSREYWKTLDDGDIADPVNEYADGGFPYVAEARWLSDYTIARLTEFNTAGTLRNKKDLARANIYGAIIYLTIGEMFDDFVLASDRTVAAAPIGGANMGVTFDSAVAMTTRALTLVQTGGVAADAELERQALGLRARARYGKALRAIAKAATVPAANLVSDAGATADATAALTKMTSTYAFKLTPTANNLAGINIGYETNNRGEIRAGSTFVNPNPTVIYLVADGIAGIKMNDPVTGVASTTVSKAIDACCRRTVGNNIPMIQTSAREMMLILAEARLAAGDTAGFLTQVNASRAVDALPAYTTQITSAATAKATLEYERKVQLYLQGRRLMDMYRFGSADARWLASGVGVRGRCLIPITYTERLTNPDAPQPNNERKCS